MKRLHVNAAAVLLVCSSAVLAQYAAPAFSDPARAERVRAILPELDSMYAALAAKEHLPGLVYGVVMDGKLIHMRTLGVADVESRAPVQPGTRFRIASMSKSFVAMAALKLRDEGKLRLDQPVSDFLPELRGLRLPTSDAPALTVRQLLTMQTGLPEDNPWGDRQMARSNAEIAALLRGGLAFSTVPGTAYEYSNLGYIMLGKVVGKASGMRFQDYVVKHILRPLGMKDTVWDPAKVPPGQTALGYRRLNDAWLGEPVLPDGDGAAMGGLITTGDDFARYVACLLDAWPARDGVETGPVRRASLREMQMPHAFASATQKPAPRVNFYGYGLHWSRDSKDIIIVGHSGGLPGYGSQYRFAPDHGVGVFAFTNLRYGPVYAPTANAVGMLIERAALPTRTVTPSAILLKRQAQVAQLVQGWDEALGSEIAAENFFLDHSRSEWLARAAAALDPLGKPLTVEPLRADNQLRGTFALSGPQGTVDVRFTLSPEREPKLQELELKAPPARP